MSGNAKDLLIRLLVDDDEIGKVEKAGERFEKGFGGAAMKTAGTGAAIALGGLAVGAIAAGNAAAEAEQSQQQLQFALDQFPATADTTAAKLMELNSALAMKTKFDDDALASGQANLAQYGLTGEQIEELTPLLADYAAKTGQDIPAAADSIGKALLGQGRALKQIGIDFEDSGSLGGNYASIMDGLSEKVGGFAESQGETAAGSAAIFQNSMGELMETLGAGLLPIMVDVTQAGAGIVGWMTENADVVQVIAAVIGVLSGGILILVGALKVFAIAQAIQTAAQWANNAAWLASPITWIIIAIIVAIGLLVAAAIWLWNNWDSVIAWISQAWSTFMGWITTGLTAFVGWWNGLWTEVGRFVSDVWRMWIVEPIQNAINWLVSAIGNGLNWISTAWSNVWNGLSSVVRGIWNGILGFIEGGVNGAIDLINGMTGGIRDVLSVIGIEIGVIPHVRMPRLALGGVTSGPMIAMIGDNPGGREYVEPVDGVARRLERVALAAARGAQPAAQSGSNRIHPDDLRALGELIYTLIVKGSQKQIDIALGG